MKLQGAVLVLSLALLAAAPARAEVWGYVDASKASDKTSTAPCSFMQATPGRRRGGP